MGKSESLKPLSELKFDSIGEEYIYLFDTISSSSKNELAVAQPTIEVLRDAYKELSGEKSYNTQLEQKYDKSSIYWSDTQEQAIVLFLKEKNEIEKNKIFSSRIYKPLKKLIENIIFTYKLFRADVDVIELQADCMSFLITKIEKYDPKTGAKAFAYLGTIAKHYLMGEKRIANKMTKSNSDIDENLEEASSKPEYVYTIDEKQHFEHDSKIFDEIILNLEEELKKPKMLINDKKVAEAIIWIFKNHEMLKVYNKNLIYYLLKERTGLQTKEITYSLGRFKNHYKVFKQDFLRSLE